MRPIGCSVTILNTIDHLGKFDDKGDEGFFVGYSLNSKAFRVFNSRTMIVEENLHIRFSKSKPNVVGSGLNWLFDIDALTRTINLEPIVASIQFNGFVGTKESDNARQARKETKPIKNYILLPLWTADPPFFKDPKSSQDDGSKPSSDDGKKVDEDPRKDSEYKDQEKEYNVNNTNNVNAASTNEVNDVGGKTSIELPFDPDIPALEDYSTFDISRDDEDDGEEADMNTYLIVFLNTLFWSIAEYGVSTSTSYGISNLLSNTAYSTQLINTTIDDDLFTYEVEVANIPCDLKIDDDSEYEADDDMGFDPSDVAFTEWLGSKFFNYKTIDHYTMKALWIY
uniref:Ribonuclease H-like domain-containing protein n=1 Tax=Tanacetum cinerariifolium TaxID=118510 RepID=A0A699H0Z2_TANCI|nr:ribonuclease H-like domain-containing protein [Tanacetum cinerariifolium]